MRVTREQRIFGCSFINVDLQNRSCTDNGCISFILVPHISTGYRTHLSDMVLWYCASWVHCESTTVIQWVFFCVSCRGLGDIRYGPYVGPLVSRPRAVVLPFSPEGGACHVYVRSCVRFRNYCLGRAACTRARTAFWSCRVQAFREVLRGARARQGVGCAVAGMAMRVACGRCTCRIEAVHSFFSGSRLHVGAESSAVGGQSHSA